jgi:hypothetical protein
MNNDRATSNVSSSIKQRANAIYLQLAECLKANSCGGRNTEALRDMQILCDNLKLISSSFNEDAGYLRDKASSLGGWAAILYSPRKHAAWDNPTESGADRVYHFILYDLARIKSIIDRTSEDS